VPAPPALRRERAILVGIGRRRTDRDEVEEHLNELGLLAETAGAVVIGRVVQDRGPVSPATLVRRGKVDELARLAADGKADLVVFDEDLSPAQVKNLQQALPVKILDRSTLIFDIFARRARTREARTQVELARMRYLLPRLTRQWGHLSRQDGGIGRRGIGETQLEIDRRLVRNRIARLSRDLDRIERDRGERRKARTAERRIALVGYTNAGKSTVLNLLTGAGAFVEDRLFATLDPLVRRCTRGGRPPFLVIDTVGFIRKLPHHLVASFRSTLEEAAGADLIAQVMDSASPALEDHIRTTNATLEELDLGLRPRLTVFNKIDLLPPERLRRLRQEHTGAVFVSAKDPAHADLLEMRIRAILGEATLEQSVTVPAADRDLLARLCEQVTVTSSAVVDDQVEVRFQGGSAETERVSRLIAAAASGTAGRRGSVS
jgi:GTP-binding protein HflX